MEGDGEAEGGGGGAVLLRQVLRDLAVLRVVHPFRVEVICATNPHRSQELKKSRSQEVVNKVGRFREASSELGQGESPHEVNKK